MNEETRECRKCHEVKPLTDFPINRTSAGGRQNICKACQAARMREQRVDESKEERAAAQAAYRAGIRKDKCAVCGTALVGHGICDDCMLAIGKLGGTPDALKLAARALKWLRGE